MPPTIDLDFSSFAAIIGVLGVLPYQFTNREAYTVTAPATGAYAAISHGDYDRVDHRTDEAEGYKQRAWPRGSQSRPHAQKETIIN